MAHVIWAEQAKNDLKEIYTFLRRDSEEYAEALTDRLFWSTDRLEQFPSSGRMIPEFRSRNLREILVENYRILYELSGNTVQILAVIHSRRNLRKATKGRVK
ncbi:MAG: type II toxin-antitoxin system RelE/ParE family toxin [Candidatus Kapaibacterium sp.]|nr:MAG: type II toxin-antitoxin system RelE/ParE family toxin [Candidatus Kapabacteria bacterium]